MIKGLIKNIAKIGASLYDMKYLINKSSHRVLLPFYHAVSDENPIHIKNLYEPRGVEEFKNDLDFLLKHYQSISLQELIEINKSAKPIPKNCFHLTFDDGLREFYTVVAPILKEKGVHATVFLNSDFIDNKDLFFRFKASILFEELQNDELLRLTYSEVDVLDGLANEVDTDFNKFLKNEQPYLTTEQITELIGDGFTFGAHSKNHPLYKELSLEEQIFQTKESLDFIKSTFNLNYSVFSFPFTDDGVSAAFFNEIDGVTDLTFGCAGIKEDTAKNHLQRIAMEGHSGNPLKGIVKSGKSIIKEEYTYCLLKQKLGKNRIERG
ncbi:MAG: polysaccharide deacetylase family protein [Vicingaceae bacterium]